MTRTRRAILVIKVLIFYSVQKVLDTAPLLREQTGAGFDIIAIAPRGVGSTLPAMTCDSTDLIASRRLWEVQDTLPGFPSNSAAENYAIGQSLGLDCASISPDLVSYTSTVHVARDMDFVRQALGQDKLLYIGQSYGTVLGGTYAALYPDRVGRMVLDGVLDFNDWYSPYKDPRLDIGDADLALNNFFQMCHTAGPDACAIWSNKTEEIRSRFLEADRRILTEPLAVTNRGVLKWAAWRTGVYSALYRPSEGFPLLAGVISEILAGSAGPHIEGYLDIVQAAATNTQTNLVDPKTGLRNGPNVDPLISCTDGGVDTFNTNTNKFTATLARYEAVSEFFGGISSQAIFMCAGARLRTNARYTDRFQNMTTANPILFIGNVADPTTPILGAQHMSSAFLGSRLLTINGTGHISFNAAQTPECANGWMAQYFQNGTLPPVGTVCQGKQTPFNPSG